MQKEHPQMAVNHQKVTYRPQKPVAIPNSIDPRTHWPMGQALALGI